MLCSLEKSQCLCLIYGHLHYLFQGTLISIWMWPLTFAKELTVLHDSFQLCQHVPLPARMKAYSFDFMNFSGLIIRFWGHSPSFVIHVYINCSPGFLSNWLHNSGVIFLRLWLLAQNKLKWFSAGSLLIQLQCWLWFSTWHTTGFHNWWCTDVLIGTQDEALWAVKKLLGWKPEHSEHQCQFLNLWDHCTSACLLCYRC